MMEKLLHERLREYIKNKSAGCKSIQECMRIETRGHGDCAWCSFCAIESIADEIEKYYIPRPRFEDGSIVQFGDEVHSRQSETGADEVNRVSFTRSGFYFNSSHDKGKKDKYRYGDFVKRPTPKVYDADGVEIKVGDTVYNVNSGNGGEVKGFDPCELVEVYTSDGGHWKQSGNNLTHERPVFDAEGVRICKGDTVWDLDSGEKLLVVEFANRECGLIQCSKEDGDCEDHNAHNLTHREPDSLEKLRDDISARADELESTPYRGTQSISREWADRLTALIERGA